MVAKNRKCVGVKNASFAKLERRQHTGPSCLADPRTRADQYSITAFIGYQRLKGVLVGDIGHDRAGTTGSDHRRLSG